MRAYFVTGTDTGVGKTTVAAALLGVATARGLRTRCMKPAESGCERGEDGSLVPRDAYALWAATDRAQDREDVVVYRFEEPVAPGVAAARAGVEVSLERIRERFRTICEDGPDFALVEGAGGLLVPLGRGKMVADLVCMLELPLIVVARPSLGTINHSLLTIEAARARGIEVAAVVFSASSGEIEQAAVTSNAEEIGRAGNVPVLGCLPHVPGADMRALAHAAEYSLMLDRLLPSR